VQNLEERDGRPDLGGSPVTAPVASIVTTTYQTPAPLLRLCIDSVLGQSLAGVESVLVVDGDDGLDGAGEALLDELATDPRLVVVRPGRVGRSAALNVGLRAASADLVGIQDADDCSHRDRLRHQVALLDRHPEVGVLGTGARVVRSATATADWPLDGAEPSLRILDRELLRSNPLIHSSFLCRRSVLEGVGGYDERRTAQVDYDLLLRLRARGETVATCDLPLVLHRRHAHQNFEGMAPWSRAWGSYRLQASHLSDLRFPTSVGYHGLAAGRLGYQVARSVVWHRLAARAVRSDPPSASALGTPPSELSTT
jgi:cellulose synthase/poly-beta-1,6-N-acetylglucosamine synthase-like glycosyltransferase